MTLENPETKNTYSDSELLSMSQKKYIEKKLDKNPDYFNFSLVNIIDTTYNDYKSFLDDSSMYEKLSLDLSRLNTNKKTQLFNQIKKKVLLFISSRELNKDLLKDKFLFEYSLSPSQKTLLISYIDKIPNSKLWDFIKDLKLRKKFLLDKNIFEDESKLLGVKNNISIDFLNKIKISKKKYNKLSNKNKFLLYSIFNSSYRIDLEELNILFSVLKKESIIALSKIIFQDISVQQLEDYWILDTNLFESYIKSEIERKSNGTISNPSQELENIYSSLDKKNIFVKSDYIDESKILRFIDNPTFKEDLLNKYNQIVDKINEEDYSKNSWDLLSKLKPIWDKEDINQSFIKYIQANSKIKKNIRDNIHLLQEWNIIKLSNKLQSWEESVWYYRIKKIDKWNFLESKSIILEDINSLWWISNKVVWEKEYLYTKFFNLLEKVSLENSSYDIEFTNKENIVESWVQEFEEEAITNIDQLKKNLSILIPWLESMDFSSNKLAILDKNSIVSPITNINQLNKTISIKIWTTNKNLSFLEFYNYFKKFYNEFQIISNIQNFESLILDLSSQKDSFKWLKLENNKKIVHKDFLSLDNDKEKQEIKYFEWNNWHAIYVESISNDKIKYYIWKIGEFDDKKSKKGWKEKSFKAEFFSDNFSQFYYDIKNYNMDSVKQDSWISNLKKEDKKFKEKIGLFSFFSNTLSVNDIVNALKFIPEWVKKKLTRNTRLKSLRLAHSISKLWWKDFELYIKAMAEQEERWLMEEIMKNLTEAWNKDMFYKITKILINKSSEEEILAAMMVVVSKKWVLYPDELKEHFWKFIWYQKLWWTKEFRENYEIELKNKKTPSWEIQSENFTEEKLISEWLKKRSTEWSIRSRIRNEYNSYLSTWIKEELENWLKNSWEINSTEWRINFFVWELKKLSFNSAIWSLTNIFDKQSWSIDMHAAPFILSMSWVWKYMNDILLTKLTWIIYTSPYSGLDFAKNEQGTIQYQQFIWELINDKFSDNIKMREDYNSILSQENYSEKIDIIYKFWSKYGYLLVDYITLKDPYVSLKKYKNPIFNSYYERLKSIHSSSGFDMKSSDIWDWIYKNTPIAWTMWWLYRWKLKTDSLWWFGWSDEARDIYFMYIEWLQSIKDDKNSSIEEKRKLFKEVYLKFEQKIRELVWKSNSPELAKWPIFDNLTSRWLSLCQSNCSWENYNKFLDNVFNNFMWAINIPVYTNNKQAEVLIKNNVTKIEDILHEN